MLIQIATKIYSLVLFTTPDSSSRKFHRNPFITLWVILQTDTQTNKQTSGTKIITSFAQEVIKNILKDLRLTGTVCLVSFTVIILYYKLSSSRKCFFSSVNYYIPSGRLRWPYPISSLPICKFRKIWSYMTLNALIETMCLPCCFPPTSHSWICFLKL